MEKLHRLWEIQERTDRLLNRGLSADREFERKLLGLVSEIGDLLRYEKWKIQSEQVENVVELQRQAIGLELADLTKLIVGLWVSSGFTPEEALDFCLGKSEMLLLERPEFLHIFQSPVVALFDLDNTAMDFWGAFTRWTGLRLENPSTYYIQEEMMRQGHPEWMGALQRFEEGGGFFQVRLFPAFRRLLVWLGEQGVFRVAMTSRRRSPLNRWATFKNLEGLADSIQFVGDEGKLQLIRILIRRLHLLAYMNPESRVRLLVFEDKPGVIQNILGTFQTEMQTGLLTLFARKWPYNLQMGEPVRLFDESDLEAQVEWILQSEFASHSLAGELSSSSSTPIST
jgi:hypothetical protein